MLRTSQSRRPPTRRTSPVQAAFRSAAAVVFGLASGLGGAAPAGAELVTFAFFSDNATVTGPEEELPAEPCGDLQGWFTFESETPDAAPGNAVQGLYEGAVQCAEIVSGDITAFFLAEGDPGAETSIAVTNDLEGVVDNYVVELATPGLGEVNDVGGFALGFDLNLTNSFSNPLGSDALPTDAPSPDDFAVNSMRLFLDPDGGSAANQVLVQAVPGPATLTRIETVPCPEPGAWAAGLAMMGALAAVRSGRPRSGCAR